jgi:hypothetical protein
MKIATTEADHQKAVIKWADDMVKFQPDKYWMLEFLFAVPNEGQHKPQYRKHQKAMGLRAGVPDLWLPYPVLENVKHGELVKPLWRGKFFYTWCGLIIEMKSKDTKGRLTKDQKKWYTYLEEFGYKVVVCWSASEAIKALEDYLE